MRRIKKVISVVVLAAMLLTGCGQETEITDTLVEKDNGNNSETAQQQTAGEQRMQLQGQESADGAAAGQLTVLDTTDMFSNRDMEIGYDENADALINLNGDSASCESDAVTIKESKITITDEGTYILSGTLADGSVTVDAEDTDKVHLVLQGVDITCESSAAIYVKQADKVFVTLAAGTENKLAATGDYVAIDDNNIDAVVFAKDDLTFNGEGALCIEAPTGHGIVCKDDLVFAGGRYEIHATGHGLSGKDSVRIAAGDFRITATKDGIHSDNEEDTSKGFVYIADGNFQITVQDDGIHAGNQLLVENGTITISESYEAMEGQSIIITGGIITVSAEDDGLNAAGENDTNAFIKLTGGKIQVSAGGDGIDSNGAFYVTGGETYVSGPENAGNGSIDYESQAQITGGILFAAGIGGMMQNFENDSTQGSMLVNLDTIQEAGTTVELYDAEGNQLIGYSPTKKYNCVLISCPQLQTGSTYTLKAGEESIDIEMSQLIYGSDDRMRGHGGMWGGAEGMPGMPEGQEGRVGGAERMQGMPEGQEGRAGGAERMQGMPERTGEMPEKPEGMPERVEGTPE